jgi:hypothetical protein
MKIRKTSRKVKALRANAKKKASNDEKEFLNKSALATSRKSKVEKIDEN